MAVTGTIQGMEDALKRLKALEPKVARRILRKPLIEGAGIIQHAARMKAPILTGQTLSAIKVGKTKNRKKEISVSVVVGKGDYRGDQFYAAFHEYGTSRQPPRPFMRPALEEQGPKVLELIQQRILEGIEAVA